MIPTDNEVTRLLQIKHPIIQAGMAGGPTTPALVAAVSNAGGLGTLGAGYMKAEQIREAIRDIRSLTNKPFAVNLFVPEKADVNEHDLKQMISALEPFRQELKVDAPSVPFPPSESFHEQLQVLLDEGVPVFSFTFGIPPKEALEQVRRQKVITIGTATTVKEARALEDSGIDLIVAQGSEAGGHRGTFLDRFDHSLIGTFSLVPQIADSVSVPVIAAGGIMDSRGVRAALALGAQGVQIGTAFLTCSESGAHEVYKQSLLESNDQSTQLTQAFSGKAARGLKNDFMRRMESHKEKILPYPVMNALTKDIRQAAAKQSNPQYMSLWGGQSSALCRRTTAKELMESLIMR